MCGIAGIYYLKQIDGRQVDHIVALTEAIRHRGPDDEGYVAISSHQGLVTPLGGRDSQVPLSNVLNFDGKADLFLSHRRLSIIDLSPKGHQPMSYDGGNIWITYNGELYNYLDLRTELEKYGHRFHTRTDTEVLLAAYNEWGEACLERFDGMWAFVIYDKRRHLLLGSRDRFGVKPLYYVHNDKFFAFASEAKAFTSLPGFQRDVRAEAVFDYLVFGLERWDDGTTFLGGVMELPPAHAFRFDLAQKRLHVQRYYELPYHNGAVWEPFCARKAAEHVARVRELVVASVRAHLLSDVPVGSCLSGGIDSSSIFCVLGSIVKHKDIAHVGDTPRAFTACYDDVVFDESHWARLAAEYTGGEWHTVYPNGDDLIVDLEDLVFTQDFPFGSTSIYAQYCVMKLAKERGVTVLLDGQGGDELFTGYATCHKIFFREMLAQGAWQDLAREWRGLENAPTRKKDILKGLLIPNAKHLPQTLKKLNWLRRNPLLEYVSPELKSRYFSSSLERLKDRVYIRPSLNEMLFSMMSSSSLPNLLRYEDRNSMRFQIEARTPFADDRKLIEEVFATPSVYKIHRGFSKWLLRESMKPYLPEKIYKRKDKIGFSTPEHSWLQANSEYFRSLMDEDLTDYVAVTKIRREWSMLMMKQAKHPVFPLWRLINMAMWIK